MGAQKKGEGLGVPGIVFNDQHFPGTAVHEELNLFEDLVHVLKGHRFRHKIDGAHEDAFIFHLEGRNDMNGNMAGLGVFL